MVGSGVGSGIVRLRFDTNVNSGFAVVLVGLLMLVPSVVVPVWCAPFALKAYLNETDGLLRVAGLGYDLPETHVFNGSTISNRHEEHQLGVPSGPCGQDSYIDSFCTEIRAGNVRCRKSVAWPIYSRPFTCASNEFCAAFYSRAGQRRDQCVSTNYYVIQAALSWSNTKNGHATQSRGYSANQNIGATTLMTSHDNKFLVKPNSLQIAYSTNGQWDGTFGGDGQDPFAINLVKGSNKVDVTWGITAGQLVNTWVSTYLVS